MDHASAIESAAAERYFLGEMTEEERADFEKHYFECPQCALNLKTLSAFRDNLLAVDGKEQEKAVAAPVRPAWQGWLDWLKPAYAAPALAVLLVVVGYQNLVEMPRLRDGLTPRAGTGLILRSEARGVVAPQAPANSPLVLNLDWAGMATSPVYRLQLKSLEGTVVREMAAPAPPPDEPLPVVIPAGTLAPGHYDLLVLGPQNQPVLGRFRFEITLP